MNINTVCAAGDQVKVFHCLQSGKSCRMIRSFYKDVSASVCIKGELSERLGVGVSVRQGCVMLLWIFNMYMDGCQNGGAWSKAEEERYGKVIGCWPVCRRQ